MRTRSAFVVDVVFPSVIRALTYLVLCDFFSFSVVFSIFESVLVVLFVDFVLVLFELVRFIFILSLLSINTKCEISKSEISINCSIIIQ